MSLGIGYIVAFFHWKGMCPELKQSVTMSLKLSDRESERFLIISYEMPEGPAALSFGRDDIVECHFLSVGQVKRESYIEILNY